MSDSYPRRDQARGIWKINDITKNIKEDGTYPQAGGAGKGFSAGNNNSPNVAIDTVTIKTTGNATDFGDLISSGGNATSCRGNATRIIFVGGSPAANTIQYITPTSSGNAADYGDLSVSRFMIGGGSNTTRAVNMGGQAPAKGNVIDFMTIPTLGNATDFGDLTESTRQIAGNCSTTRGFAMGGDDGPSPGGAVNTINMVEISTTGNAIDFGDLISVTASAPQGCGSFTRGLNGGGQTPSYTAVINTINYGSLGNAIDFGDLTQARRLMAAFSDTQRGVWAGGIDPSSDSNVIDFVTISSFGNATDFGDLSAVTQSSQSGSDSHQGIETRVPRAPELYSPTGKPLAQGAGIGNIGFLMGGYNPAKTKNIDFIDIANLGNSVQFGDISHDEMTHNAGFSSATRGFSAGGSDAGMSNNIVYIEMKSKGNSADFGDATISYWYTTGASNSTRGLTFGGESPTPGTASNVIQYVTMASIGNATDFGDMTQIRYTPMGTGNSTRGICSGGYATSPTSSVVNTMDYITIGSTGNATDFGDLTQARYDGGAVSSTTRSVIGGGGDAGSTQYNIIDYVTIASTGNATDFGDLTEARSGIAGCTGNSLRALWLGGQSPTRATMDYVTIASTGNAADFGDLREATYGGSNGTISTGHGGLS